MKLTILELAVMYAAVDRYIPLCEGYLNNPENHGQTSFIQGDVKIARDLKNKIKREYIDQGGDPSRL